MKLTESIEETYRMAGFRSPLRAIRILRGLLSFDSDITGYLGTYSKNGELDASRYSAKFQSFLRIGDRNPPYNDTLHTLDLHCLLHTHDLNYRLHTLDLHYPKFPWVVAACIGFDLDDKILTVKQIQGCKGEVDSLRPLKWERMLLRIVTDWASKSGFKQVRVQRAEDNKWRYRVGIEKLRMRYDVTAKRCGFRYDEESKHYILNLNGSFK